MADPKCSSPDLDALLVEILVDGGCIREDATSKEIADFLADPKNQPIIAAYSAQLEQPLD